MTDELILYTNPMSRGRTARWMLEETGQPYRAEILEFGAAMKAPGYLAINPMGKVPALRHGGVVVTEAAAICAYLADAFPGTGLAPAPGSPLRGTYYRWLFFTAGPLEAAEVDTALGVTVPEDRRVMTGYGTLETVLDVLECALGNGEGFLVGDGFTAADLVVGANLGWTMNWGLIPRRPVFERFVARLAERPAFQKASAADDAQIPPG